MSISTDMMAQMRERMFAKLDPDGDGQIDLSQVQAQSEEMGVNDSHFADMYEHLAAADGDGKVSKQEFEAMKPLDPPPPLSSDLRGELDLLKLLDSLYSEDGSGSASDYLIGAHLNLPG
jgi:hypothetical protein